MNKEKEKEKEEMEKRKTGKREKQGGEGGDSVHGDE